jgi:hypothetical protein
MSGGARVDRRGVPATGPRARHRRPPARYDKYHPPVLYTGGMSAPVRRAGGGCTPGPTCTARVQPPPARRNHPSPRGGRPRPGPPGGEAELAPLIPRVTAAAAPLFRHPDQGIATATERLVKAAYNIKTKEALDRALREFGRAVAPVTTAPPRWWRRPRWPA